MRGSGGGLGCDSAGLPHGDVSRTSIGRLAGLLTTVGGIVVMLAGSDRPPPPGFLAVVVTAMALGIVTAVLVPRMLERADRRGAVNALLSALAVGAAAGAAVALLFIAVGPGEPSTPDPGLLDLAVFTAVVAMAGALAGAVIGGLALTMERFSRSGPSPDGG